MPARTLFEKIWDAHLVHEAPGESALLYIDLHLVHEVTSPQAFEGLRLTGRRVRRPELTIATMDHNTPTWPLSQPVTDAIAIGTSEVEHVLATQTVPQRKPKAMEVRVNGELPMGVTAKDVVLGIIGRIGISGGIGHVIEYTGSVIRGLSMEGRMTVCNMSIEAGARAGMIAPDQTTFAYLEGRPHAP